MTTDSEIFDQPAVPESPSMRASRESIERFKALQKSRDERDLQRESIANRILQDEFTEAYGLLCEAERTNKDVCGTSHRVQRLLIESHMSLIAALRNSKPKEADHETVHSGDY